MLFNAEVNMSVDFTVVVVGGGLAGLTSALHLNKLGIGVTVIEKGAYPQHKVCGEYISNEVLPYLKWLDLDISTLHPTSINKFQISTTKGRIATCSLPQGGFGISRFALDHFLYQQLSSRGVSVMKDTVEEITFGEDQFTIATLSGKKLIARHVLGAFGKRANLDLKMERAFIKQKAPFLAVKAHYHGSFESDLVALHNFDGGYCGVSKVENNLINICYLANYNSFKKHKNIDAYQEHVLKKNPHLKQILDKSTIVFEEPITISQVSFSDKRSVENHVLMIGDTAGLIHPLCGNGMAMAIHSAKIASELIGAFTKGEIKARRRLENLYSQKWNKAFGFRIKVGRLISGILSNPIAANFLLSGLAHFPFLLKQIIKKTHGKPIPIYGDKYEG
ncbi:flavin-dependent dehydrogenase [Pedobacter sp. UYP30]|uniref:NAD(P)/FAD-dependent oxidoreductase n=1 Tax=Pedobacter sp. UYP30 TaxID=1756400 RepID=UPI003399564F